MPNRHVSAQFARLLEQRQREVFDTTEQIYKSNMIPTLFNVMDSDSAFEEFFDVEGLGDIPKFTGAVSYLNFSPGYYRKIEPAEYAAALSFERKLIDDKKYSTMDNRTEALRASYERTQEKDAAKAFNNSFSSAFDYQTSEEGKALCSSTHTTKVAGVSTSSGFDNAGTTALSKTAVSAARLAMRRLRIGNGELADSSPDTLIVPVSLYDTACEVVGYDPRSGANSELDPDTGNNKINIVRGMKVIEWNLLDDNSTTNWFMVDSKKMKRYLVWIDRVKADFNARYDFDTFSMDESLYARWGYGFNAWQWIYGMQVS